jgi:hypothetical protein
LSKERHICHLLALPAPPPCVLDLNQFERTLRVLPKINSGNTERRAVVGGGLRRRVTQRHLENPLRNILAELF